MLSVFALLLALADPGVTLEAYSSAIYADTPPVCDRQFYWGTWINRWGAVHVYKWKWIPLASLGLQADIQFSLWLFDKNGEPLEVLDEDSWDHYAEPTQVQSTFTDLSPHYKTVQPGQSLRVRMSCGSMNGAAAAFAVPMHFWFTVTKP